jgi:hypothetical protein
MLDLRPNFTEGGSFVAVALAANEIVGNDAASQHNFSHLLDRPLNDRAGSPSVPFRKSITTLVAPTSLISRF